MPFSIGVTLDAARRLHSLFLDPRRGERERELFTLAFSLRRPDSDRWLPRLLAPLREHEKPAASQLTKAKRTRARRPRKRQWGKISISCPRTNHVPRNSTAAFKGTIRGPNGYYIFSKRTLPTPRLCIAARSFDGSY